MAKRLIPAIARRLAALVVLSALGACASAPAEHSATTPLAGWRIVERVGEARYAPPGTSVWLSATTGRVLDDGSKVATGRGGRLIIDTPRRHLSVGPDSLFVLPHPERGERLDQQAGWLRYRIVQAGAQPFQVHTRALDLELLAGVVDVQVNQLATEVTVKEGQVRVATPDGLRRTQMLAGQVARTSGPDGQQLALRRTPDAALEPVEPVILPAIHPTPTAPGLRRAPDVAMEPAEPVILPAIRLAPTARETPARRDPAGAGEFADPALPSDQAALGGLAGAQAGVSRQAIPRLDPSDEAPVPASRAPAAAALAGAQAGVSRQTISRLDPRSEGEADPITAAAAAHRAPAGLGAVGPTPSVMQPGSLQFDGAARRAPAGLGAVGPTPSVMQPGSPQSDDAAVCRSTFERLTVGVLDGIQPSRPTSTRPRASIR